ncbi:MAG TPA: sigma 54-interacting transcriptional regulator [Pseudomonas sp.]|uniref:sigma 54-interacting transcriptional regulator n=1 Tax=Pseudomonas sp. TaxID=306 RepID=UPI002EDAAFBA
MSHPETYAQPLLTFPDAEKSPLSIRAKALVFFDPRSRRLREEMELLATQDLPVLIQGESGTGKELLARHIHRGSDRAGLFVSVNCGAISPTYADAELFGYAAGAHSGSVSSRAGWFGSATGGTLYLDEIADLPLSIQIKLLAALENREVTRVGAHQPSPVDVRLVAATSIDLRLAVAAGKFHERLYHYLSEGQLDMPALREQPGNILPLAEYFLGIYSQRFDFPMPLISDAAQQVLEQHTWPGNTRELENVIHFALLVSNGDEVLPEHLSLPQTPDALTLIERQLARWGKDATTEQLFAVRRLLAEVDLRLAQASR